MTGPTGKDRRREPRYGVRIDVDWGAPENFLFATITDISTMGMFVATSDPAAVGSHIVLRFSPAGGKGDGSGSNTGDLPIEVRGEVVWATESPGSKGNPGMGVRFIDVPPATRSRILDLVRAVAYLGGGG